MIVEAKVDVRDAPAWATFEKAMQSLEGTEQAAAVGSEAMHRPADDHAGVSGDSSDDEMDPLQRPTPVSRAEGTDLLQPLNTLHTSSSCPERDILGRLFISSEPQIRQTTLLAGVSEVSSCRRDLLLQIMG